MVWSGGQLREGDAVNAPSPARQVTLVGKARSRRDFSKAGSAVANQLDGALQSQMHDVTVRGHSDGSGEDAREVEGAAPRQSCERGDLDRLVQVRNDIVPEPLQHIPAQHATRPAFAS